jgi:hypothetical protein
MATEELTVIAFFVIRNICNAEDQCHIYRKHGYSPGPCTYLPSDEQRGGIITSKEMIE